MAQPERRRPPERSERGQREPQRRDGGNALTKPGWLGQPVWMWLVGGVVIIGGYLYLRNKSSASTATAGQACTDANGNPGTTDANGNCVPATAASPTGTSSGQLLTWLADHQSSPGTATAQPGGTVSGAAPSGVVAGVGTPAPPTQRSVTLAQAQHVLSQGGTVYSKRRGGHYFKYVGAGAAAHLPQHGNLVITNYTKSHYKV